MSKSDAIGGVTANDAGNVFSRSLWDGSDKNSFDSLDHPGYSIESNAENFTGGWHAYRKVWGDSDDENNVESPDWIKEIIDDVTKFDYESMEIGRPPRILVLYGSLRPTSFSRKCGMFPCFKGMRFGSQFIFPSSITFLIRLHLYRFSC